MPKQAAQRLVFKVRSSRLKKAKWNLSLSLADARRNDEVIPLHDSQVMRWIDELNAAPDTDEAVAALKAELRAVRKEPQSPENKTAIRRIYDDLDRVQFKKDYVHIIMDSTSDYMRACKGFKINGIKYVRLLGTAGGIKNSTIVFVNAALADELRRRIDNGRQCKPIVPAKLEAYRALTCSGSTPVSMPKGILVVPDYKTHFKEDVIMLNDADSDEPVMSYLNDYDIELDACDGYGLISPELAERWSAELGLSYVASGLNTRISWEKGLVFVFDFHDFANKVAGGEYVVTDAWGHSYDIRNIELVLTTSMLKLWDSYDSIESYLANCEKNHYTFAITKVCPKELEDERSLNYQFLQSFELTDEQIDQLISPTLNEIRDVLTGDYRKALLFLRGTHLNDANVEAVNDYSYFNAIMVDRRVYDDPFVRRKIYESIAKRIMDAKIGVISVHGNYSIVGGDPYALCQHIFGLPVTGLLKAGELYNQYWSDHGARYVAGFRAPMSCHNNIRKIKVAWSEEMAYWYRHIRTATLVNSWDTLMSALNGMDFDGDLMMLTDDETLVDNIRPTRTIMCIQRSANKSLPDETALIKSNIAGFGDDIGRTTNFVTSMYDVMAGYTKDSIEYQTLEYRIQSGQLYQQNCIDMPHLTEDFVSLHGNGQE